MHLPWAVPKLSLSLYQHLQDSQVFAHVAKLASGCFWAQKSSSLARQLNISNLALPKCCITPGYKLFLHYLMMIRDEISWWWLWTTAINGESPQRFGNVLRKQGIPDRYWIWSSCTDPYITQQKKRTLCDDQIISKPQQIVQNVTISKVMLCFNVSLLSVRSWPPLCFPFCIPVSQTMNTMRSCDFCFDPISAPDLLSECVHLSHVCPRLVLLCISSHNPCSSWGSAD